VGVFERGESRDHVDLAAELEQALLQLDLVRDDQIHLIEQLVVEPIREAYDTSIHVECNSGDLEQDSSVAVVWELPNKEVHQFDHLVFVSVGQCDVQSLSFD